MEKCIFLDRFLQHPKDFRKIASFLKNKNTKDCIAFYYDSKQTVPYKAALKEHLMRRKRRGDYSVWDATIQAAIATGAVVTAGKSEQKPLVFTLPENDFTFHTRALHPLQRETFDRATVELDDEVEYDEDDLEPKTRSGRPSNRYKRDPFFTLAKKERVLLKTKSKSASSSLSSSPIPYKKARIMAEDDAALAAEKLTVPEPGKLTPTRKAPQKWTSEEKKIFVDTLEKHGKVSVVDPLFQLVLQLTHRLDLVFVLKGVTGKPWLLPLAPRQSIKSKTTTMTTRNRSGSSAAKRKESKSQRLTSQARRSLAEARGMHPARRKPKIARSRCPRKGQRAAPTMMTQCVQRRRSVRCS